MAGSSYAISWANISLILRGPMKTSIWALFIESKMSFEFVLRAGSLKGNIAVQYAEFEVFRRGNFEAATSILLLTSLAAGIVTACYLKRH